MAVEKPPVYTVIQQLPIEADGRIRYRIKSQSESFERVVTEDHSRVIGELVGRTAV
jgi:hypothetical protein